MTNGARRAMNEHDEHPKPKYDLEERTAKFGEAIIRFAKKIPVTSSTSHLSTNWSAPERALDQTIAKRTTPNRRRTFDTRLPCAERSLAKRNTGYA
jgi:hypothetical protein